jgi:small nuclear ribonucleoprotein (snRNP)-like protein
MKMANTPNLTGKRVKIITGNGFNFSGKVIAIDEQIITIIDNHHQQTMYFPMNTLSSIEVLT